MTMICTICNHPKRLLIDREIVQGISNSVIARKYGLSNPDLVARHAKTHMSRQLAQAWEKKDLNESMDLLGRIDQLIKRCEKIFRRNYAEGKDTVALKALSEQRQTFQLLSNISFQLHQARLAELEIAQREDGSHEYQEAKDFNQQVANILTDYELMLLNKLLEKVETQNPNIDVVNEYLPDPYITALEAMEKAYFEANTPEELEEATGVGGKYLHACLPGVHRPHWAALDTPPDPETPLDDMDEDQPEQVPDTVPEQPMTRTKQKRGPGRPPGSKLVRESLQRHHTSKNTLTAKAN